MKNTSVLCLPSLFFMGLFFAIANSGLAQGIIPNYYLLSLERHNHRYLYTEGQAMKFKLADDPVVYTGLISGIKPGYINVNFGQEENIPIATSDFRRIYRSREGRLSQTFRKLGFILPIAGSLFFGLDAVNTLHRNEGSFNWKPDAGIAGGACLIGLVMVLSTSEQKMRIGRSWKLKVVSPDNYKYRRKMPGEI